MFQTSLRHKDKYKINTTEQMDSMHNNTQQSSNHKQTKYKSNNVNLQSVYDTLHPTDTVTPTPECQNSEG